MKTNIICLIFLLFWQLTLYAQDSDCGLELTQGQIDFMDATRSTREAINVDDFDNITLPLVAHIVRRTNGTGGLSNTDLNTGMDDLNTAFAQLGVRIDLCEINYIDNDAFFNTYISYSTSIGSSEFNLAIPNRVDDKINIFFVPSAQSSWSSFPSYKDLYDKDWTILRNDHAINGSTLPHELGHYFNLYHTHQGVSSGINVHAAELVDGSNCGPNVGDELCDTPADPRLSGCVTTSCQYVCNRTDANGDVYRPDPRNIMSYSLKFCRNYFSPQQRTRMLQSLFYDRTNLASSCSSCDASLVLDSPVSGSIEQYSASNFIESTQTIQSDANVTYRAGESIHLSSGFHAKTGAYFRAYIEGCYVKTPIGNQLKHENPTETISQAEESDSEIAEGNIPISCYPNPFSNQATLEFDLETDTEVELALFDMNGRKIKTILNSFQSKGAHKVDIQAAGLANGMYFIQIKTAYHFSSLKIMVQKN